MRNQAATRMRDSLIQAERAQTAVDLSVDALKRRTATAASAKWLSTSAEGQQSAVQASFGAREAGAATAAKPLPN